MSTHSGAIERRLLIQCSAGALWTVVSALPKIARASTAHSEREARGLRWEQFVEQIGTLAQSRVHEHLIANEFVRRVATVGQHLDLADQQLAGACAALRQQQSTRRMPLVLAGVHERVSCEIVLLSLEAGFSIPLHDHPQRSVVSICVAGEAKVVNYDLRQHPNGPALTLRSNTTLRPSQGATLTETDGNIHTIAAGRQTQLIDVFCPPMNKGAACHWYKAEPERRNDPTVLRVTSMS